MTMATGARDRVWLPYVDEPLLTPAMVDGYDTTPAPELDRLSQYLDALVAARRAPVHVAVAFNAAYFGYDLKGQGYGTSPLDPDAFPVVTFGGRTPALPVGAMAHIATGSQPLFAEIVYKEGRHPRISALGDVPGWVSGAPAGAEGPGRPCPHDAPVRRELLVPDPHAFGAALSLSPAQLNRLRDHSRWIDKQGHVLVDAVHPSREVAERDDIAAYAAFLLTTARAQLLSPFVPVSLVELAGTQQEEVLRGALTRLLDVIRRVLVSSDALRMWGPYAMTRKALAARWADPGPLGGNDMNVLASALRIKAEPAARRRYGLPSATTVYTAVGPRLSDFPGAESRLSGVEYATAVCSANLAIAGVIQGESENGLFQDGTRVSLDDVFEGGGVWRTRNPGADEADGDPLVAAAAGWGATVQLPSPRPTSGEAPGQLEGKACAERFDGAVANQAEEPNIEAPSEPVDAPLVDEAGLGAGQLLRIGDSEIAWRMPLRLAHLMDGYLPLRPLIADELAGLGQKQTVVRLELAHPGGELEDSEAVQDTVAELCDGNSRLLEVEWPLDFFPGLELHLQWPRGGRVIRATTTLLETPVAVGERTIEHQYDVGILTREDAPGSTRTSDSAAGLNPSQLVMRTVRRCGLLTPDGHALLDRSALPTATYGEAPVIEQVAALEEAVEALVAVGRLYMATGSRCVDGRPHYPGRPDEPEISLIGYTPDPVPVPRSPSGQSDFEQTGQTVPVVLHSVPGHLRRLLPDHSPSAAQRAAFREHCRRLGKADGWDLPDGYTFVTQHTRGR
ncbi:hypothetical protein [Streptomyces sp. NBC_00829]|uniref:hypothetical protein n=1 Tax=Streptomyces sp. NBC_00829 TaxID=2903679 RepID=UPI00386801AD|nr:hypothetical protein OG293_33130 [Streptomyces sp. NBC_00829]